MNQSNVFGRCEQYNIDSMVHLLGNEVDRAMPGNERLLEQQWTRVNVTVTSVVSPASVVTLTRVVTLTSVVKNRKWRTRQSQDEIAEFLTETERANARITKHHCKSTRR